MAIGIMDCYINIYGIKKLESAGILTSIKIGKETYFINHELMKILSK
jgi:hypothetical protein